MSKEVSAESTLSVQALIDDLPTWDDRTLWIFGAVVLSRAGRDWPERRWSSDDIARLMAALLAERRRRRSPPLD